MSLISVDRLLASDRAENYKRVQKKSLNKTTGFHQNEIIKIAEYNANKNSYDKNKINKNSELKKQKKEFNSFRKNLILKNQRLNETNLDEVIDRKLSSMSVEEKVSQLFILGFHGTSYSGKIKMRIQKFNPGAIIVYKRNIKSLTQIKKFNFSLQKDYQKRNDFPIYIMTDQEGGAVSRIKRKFTPPSALSVGLTNQPIYANDYGMITGRIMNLLGFNFNLAPVADLSNPYKKNFIGNRSFGDDPKKVLGFAQQFAQGLLNANIVPTFKHYPGHGGTVNDSHRKLPKKMGTYKELENTHFYPFKKIAEFQTPSAIMTAHISFPNIDNSGVPTTYSKVLITDILRNKFGYKGLVITDDLRMAGASIDHHEHIGQRALDAFLAGCDMLMLAWGYKKQNFAKKFLIKSVKNKKMSLTRLDESVKRILKYKYLYSQKVLPQKNSSKLLLSSFKELKRFSNDISLRNFEASTKKIKKKKAPDESSFDFSKKISVFSASSSFYKNLKLNSQMNYDFYQLAPKKEVAIDRIFRNNPRKMGVFYVSGIGTSKILDRLEAKTKKQLIVVNTTYPGVIENPNHYYEVININTENAISGRWTNSKISKKLRYPASK